MNWTQCWDEQYGSLLNLSQKWVNLLQIAEFSKYDFLEMMCVRSHNI